MKTATIVMAALLIGACSPIPTPREYNQRIINRDVCKEVLAAKAVTKKECYQYVENLYSGYSDEFVHMIANDVINE